MIVRFRLAGDRGPAAQLVAHAVAHLSSLQRIGPPGRIGRQLARSQKVEESRSREPIARAKSSRSPGRVCQLLDSRLSTPRLFRNKPGMSMKTKDMVKKSRVECQSKVEPQPGACLSTPRLSTPRLSAGTNRECR